MFISNCIAIHVCIKMVIGAMSEEKKIIHKVSWEQLASMRGVNLRHQVNAFLMIISGGR